MTKLTMDEKVYKVMAQRYYELGVCHADPNVFLECYESDVLALKEGRL